MTERQLVVFSLSGEEFGVNINEVKEIIRMEQITVIPNTPFYVKGVINLRGNIVVIIDLAMKLGLSSKEFDKNTRIIIIEVDNNVVGMIVDSATEVLRLAEANVKAAPAVITDKINGSFLEGVGIINDRLLILLDLAKVINSNEIASLKTVGSSLNVSSSNVIKATGELVGSKKDESKEEDSDKRGPIKVEEKSEEEKKQLKEQPKEQPKEESKEEKKESSKEKASESSDVHPALKDVEEGFHFITHEGDPIANIHQLSEYIHSLDDDTFKTFVNEEKNDFYNWIKNSVKDEELANKIQHIKNKGDVTAELLNRILSLKFS